MFPPVGAYARGPFGSYGLYGSLIAYGSERLTEASPQQTLVEPLTVDEMTSYLKLPVLDPPDEARQELVASFIQAAREQAEILQGGRDIVRKQFDRYHDYWPGFYIELRKPLISVDLVQYRDSDGELHTLTEGTDYIVDTAKEPGLITQPWGVQWPSFTPWPTSAILIRYTSGHDSDSVFWQDAGARVKNGMRLLISWWYNNRLPFANATKLSEYPYQVTECLTFGSVPRAR